MKGANLKNYETPAIEVVEVRVEHGFATSAGAGAEKGIWKNSFDFGNSNEDWSN